MYCNNAYLDVILLKGSEVPSKPEDQTITTLGYNLIILFKTVLQYHNKQRDGENKKTIRVAMGEKAR